MKNFYFLLIFIFGCGEVGEQIIGYNEIVQSAWEYFSIEEYEQARTEFTNALDYEVLNNISEAYIGIGWCNLYIANQVTDITETNRRNELRDIAYDNFIEALEFNIESDDKISNELMAIMSAGLVFVYDYKLLNYYDLYYNNNSEFNENCYSGNNPDDFRSNCIIPIAKDIVSESNLLIDYQSNFEFPFDASINIDDIRFIRARLAFSFDDFSSNEFQTSDNTSDETYFIHQFEICLINDLPLECSENLGFDEYCLGVNNDPPNFPNIPVEDFLGCLSSFYTPTENP
jgi:hypothetical protein